MKHQLKKVFDEAYNGKYYYFCKTCCINVWRSPVQYASHQVSSFRFDLSLIKNFNESYKKAELVSVSQTDRLPGARIQKYGNVYIMNSTGIATFKIDCLFSSKELLVKSIIE